jgi:hypothetical protein
MKKYQYLASWDDQTLTRVGEPVVVLGDSNISQVEVILPSNFLLDPTKAAARIYFLLPGEKESDFKTLETATKDENGDSHVTWTIKHAHTEKGGRLAFSLAIIGDDAQWNSRTVIIPVYESRYQPESEEAEEPYTGRLTALEGSMASIRGEFAEVQEDFEELKETATLGTPIPESLVANMTEGHVYIYTGTETGYIAGHVYYYVDGALKDGGVYGGTAVDATLTQSGQAADAKVTGEKIAEIKEDLSALEEQGGLSATMKTNLAVVLANIVTKDDVSTEISALIDELRAVWTVANILTNASTSNHATEIAKGSAYVAVITPDTGYALAGVIVTMGGVDVTAQVYDSGTISISKVIGNLTITVTAVEESEAAQYTGYITVGSPNIVDGILTPAEGSYIKSNCSIDTGEYPWRITTKILSNTNTVYQDLIQSVDSAGNHVRAFIVEKPNIEGFNFGMLIGNGSSWGAISDTKALVLGGFTLGIWHRIDVEWSGADYYMRRYTSDSEYVESTYQSATQMGAFTALAVGMKINALFDGQIDLKSTKMYINSSLYWSAV